MAGFREGAGRRQRGAGGFQGGGRAGADLRDGTGRLQGMGLTGLLGGAPAGMSQERSQSS